ncbi:Wound-induced basic protein [Linum perenne]
MIYDVNSPLFRSFLSQKGGTSDKRYISSSSSRSMHPIH